MNQYEYNGELMSLYAIAQKEGISLTSLIRALEKESDDIYKAVEAVKDRQRLIIEYQGEMLTINQIAQREGVKPATLRKVYNELGNINAAVEQVKESLRTIRGRRISVEYRGKKTPLSVVAREEGIRYVALRDAYKEIGDLSKAITLVKERQHRFRGEFEYDGEIYTTVKDYSELNVDTTESNVTIYGNTETLQIIEELEKENESDDTTQGGETQGDNNARK